MAGTIYLASVHAKNTKCQCMTFLIKTRVRLTLAVHKLWRFSPIP